MQKTNESTRNGTHSERLADGGRRLAAYAAAAGGASRLASCTAVAGGACVVVASGAHAAVTIVDLPSAQTGSNIGFNIDAAMTAGNNGDFSVSAAAGSAIYWNLTGGQGTNPTGLFANQRWNGGLLGSGVDVFDTLAGGTWTGRASVAAGWGNEIMSLPSGETGYIGFRVAVAEPETWRYGWIELKNIGGTLTVDRWAYESDFDTAIQTPGASAVPGGAGLAALAFGAAGLRGRRRNRD